jgi:hypothetical protein
MLYATYINTLNPGAIFIDYIQLLNLPEVNIKPTPGGDKTDL